MCSKVAMLKQEEKCNSQMISVDRWRVGPWKIAIQKLLWSKKEAALAKTRFMPKTANYQAAGRADSGPGTGRVAAASRHQCGPVHSISSSQI